MSGAIRLLRNGGIACAAIATLVGPVAGAETWRARQARAIVTVRHDVREPGGVAYDPARNRLVVLERRGAAALALDAFADPVASSRLDVPIPGAHATLDPAGKRLVWVDEASNEVVTAALGENGLPSGAVRRTRLPYVGPVRVAGIAIGSGGELHVLDRLSRRIVTVPAAGWSGANRTGVEPIAIELGDVGPGELRGLAYDAAAKRFYTIVAPDRRLIEFDEAGAVTKTLDLKRIALREPGGMTVAPSGDPTDEPSTRSIYVADPARSGATGAVVEIKLHRMSSATLAAAGAPPTDEVHANVTGTHVRTIQTWRWSPPSSDCSGITWDPVKQRLLMTDGEVEETRVYGGANYFELSLTGTLLASANTTRFSDEPVGITRTSNRVIISDDDLRHVFIINVGGDNRVGGSDDTWTSFDTRDYGSIDPEGVSYDIATSTLFIADGLSDEMFLMRPGSDGQHGTSDDDVTHWDTGRINVLDPENVEFDPQTNTLWMIGSDGEAILNTTLSGTVINSIDVSSISVRSPSGLAIAPHSSGSGARSLYIACRGTDNDSDPNENDGTIVEVTASLLGSGGGGGGGGTPPSEGDFPVGASSDDAEQSSNGSVLVNSSDIELTTDGTTVQVVGFRFPNVTIAKNATITSAWIQFTADASHSGGTVLTIQGQDIDNAATFASTTNNISSRARTSASVGWNPGSWTAGAAGTAQQTPSLTSIVQHLVNRGGWASGNAMAFIITGTGTREAVAIDGDPSGAAYLHIETQVSTTNLPPTVDAGPAQSITLPSLVALDGTVGDDGLPSGSSVTTTWTKFSGPSGATIVSPNAVDTDVSFTTDGDYVFRLTASDGTLSAFDDVAVTVAPAPGGGGGGGSGSSWRIAASSDDAEQGGSAGTVNLTSGDLELVTDGSKVQTVGLRFANVNVAKNATITDAWIQFTADASHSGGTTITIQGQAADHAATFTTAVNGISIRARTGASATWSPASWSAGGAGAAQKTPSLAAIVQQLVNRGGWSSGNAMAFIITGSGLRSAVSFEGDVGAAAVLHIESTGGSGGGGNVAPIVDAGGPITTSLTGTANLDGTVTDDGLANPTPTTTWSKFSGPAGTVVFQNANSIDTQASFPAAGTYVLRLTANDGELESFDDVTVVVTGTGGGGGGTTTLERRVAATNDDAEESASGVMDINSGDLELVNDGSNQQVGLRFTNVTIPPGATIVNAWVQFTLDEKQSGAIALQIFGEAANLPIPFATANKISTRTKTSASVAWSPPDWTESAGTAGPGQRTANLAPVIQQIVDRAGWASGNPLVLIITGTGHRTAQSHNLSPANAPLLHIEYQ